MRSPRGSAVLVTVFAFLWIIYHCQAAPLNSHLSLPRYGIAVLLSEPSLFIKVPAKEEDHNRDTAPLSDRNTPLIGRLATPILHAALDEDHGTLCSHCSRPLSFQTPSVLSSVASFQRFKAIRAMLVVSIRGGSTALLHAWEKRFVFKGSTEELKTASSSQHSPGTPGKAPPTPVRNHRRVGRRSLSDGSSSLLLVLRMGWDKRWDTSKGVRHMYKKRIDAPLHGLKKRYVMFYGEKGVSFLDPKSDEKSGKRPTPLRNLRSTHHNNRSVSEGPYALLAGVCKRWKRSHDSLAKRLRNFFWSSPDSKTD